MLKRSIWLLAVMVVAAMALTACIAPADQTPTVVEGTATPTEVIGGMATPTGAVTPTEEAEETASPTGAAAGTATPTGAATGTATPTGVVGGTATPTGAAAGTATPTGEVTGTATPDTGAVSEALPDLQEGAFEGEIVSVIASWAGDEQESFMAMVAPWEQYTGATIAYEGTRDLNAVLTTRVQGGNPPNIAGLPGPTVLQQFARDGALVDLGTFMDMDQLEQTYDRSWLDLATLDGSLYGIFTKVAVKSLVWYSPPSFQQAGYKIPVTWDELMTLSEQMVDDGNTPWCIGLESAATSGWPGTDWIEDIMLRTAGPALYDQWRQHEIPWTHEAVRNAWETFGDIVGNSEYVSGGAQGALSTNFGEAVYPVYQDPPGCYMHRQATFIEEFITSQFPDLEPVVDYNYFVLPPAGEGETPEGTAPILSAGDLFGLFGDTPAARSLIQWLASAQAQEIWARRGGFISPNKNVDLEAYPDPLISQAAELLTTADVVRFDASDLMPAAVNDAFLAGVLEFAENPDNLDEILQNIEGVAEDAYAEQGQGQQQ